MKLRYEGADTRLAAATAFVNRLAGDEAFWTAVAQRGRFDHTEHSGAEVAQLMRHFQPVVSVETYRKPWPFHRNTNAYADPDTPLTIFYNSRKLGRSVGEMVNTLVHEFVHVVDHSEAEHPDYDFTHDGQGEAGNDGAAPNWIGDQAERFYDVSLR